LLAWVIEALGFSYFQGGVISAVKALPPRSTILLWAGFGKLVQ
jgi:hypothetical protein